MTEKNRHILDEALKGMPVHKAGAAGWESIAGGLSQAEETQFLSENLSSLPAHKAPAGAWSGIAAGLKAPFFSLSGGLMKTAGFITAMSAIITALLLFIPDQKKEESVNSAEVEKAVTAKEGNISETSSGGTKQSPSENAGTLRVEQEAENSSNKKQSTSSAKNISAIYNKVSPHADNNAFKSGVSSDAVAENAGFVAGSNIIRLKAIPLLDVAQSNTAAKIPTRIQAEKANTNYYNQRGIVDFGIAPFYSLINYQKADAANMEVPESISSFGLDLMADFPGFFIKSGISYLSFSEKAKYTFEFRQNELVYSYHYVDSAFINHTTGDINYYTSERNIYDSVPGVKADEIKYEYRVLQIPLIAGYKVYNKNNISFSINAGLGADLRIGGREYKPVFNQEDARVVNVVNYLDYRFKINWRFIAGAGLYYQFSNHFSFYLEPSFQKYLKSLHQTSGPGNISYLEIKSGIIFNF